MADDAVAYLRNAHAQAEEWATAASDGQGWWFINPRFADHRTVVEFVIEGERGPVAHIDVQEHNVEAHQAEALLIQSNNPAAVLARVRAERAILAEHASDYGDCKACGRASDETNGLGFAFFEAVDWPCTTVRLLAAGWGWTEETS